MLSNFGSDKVGTTHVISAFSTEKLTLTGVKAGGTGGTIQHWLLGRLGCGGQCCVGRETILIS
jgi:hypothetical protein